MGLAKKATEAKRAVTQAHGIETISSKLLYPTGTYFIEANSHSITQLKTICIFTGARKQTLQQLAKVFGMLLDYLGLGNNEGYNDIALENAFS